MGRRKERRLAAISNAGRRVKLDLFAEPPGDLGGSSAQEEVGVGDDAKSRARLSNSPSSSGQQPENPLLLLGQYSDDDLDEGSSKALGDGFPEDSSIDHNDQAPVKESSEMQKAEDSESAAQNIEQLVIDNTSVLPDALHKLDKDNDRTRNSTDSAELHEETAMEKAAAAPETSDAHVIEDVNSGWKLVLHEESNQYYYWNVDTGETSWEVPSVLVQVDKPIHEKDGVSITEEKEIDVQRFKELSPSLNVDMNGSSSLQPSNISKAAYQNHENGHEHIPNPEESIGAHGCDALENKMDDDISGPDDTQGGKFEAGMECSQLIRHCEYLLEQLKFVKGSEHYFQAHERVSKYVLEVEVRLADIKSLASYGSQLLPFWIHSESKLKQLESSIKDEFEASQRLHENAIDDSKEVSGEKKDNNPTCGEIHAHNHAEVEQLQEIRHNQNASNGHVSSTGFQVLYSDSGPGAYSGGDEPAKQSEPPGILLHSGEEDMDVDMEVEDTDPASNSNEGVAAAVCQVPTEQLDLRGAAAGQKSSASELTFSVPPPLVEDWIPPPPPDDEPVPPPPPDDEPFPPPPPDEPPETSYPPPTEMVIVQPFAYTNHYDLPYPGSNFQYYTQTTAEPTSSNIYPHAEGSEAAISHPALYYEAMPNMYAAVASMVNNVQPSAYYGLQDGVALASSVNSVMESSTIRIDSIQGSVGSDLNGSLSVCPEATKSDIHVTDGKTGKVSRDVSLSDVSSQTLANKSVVEGPSVSSSSATTVSVDAASTAPKVQPKVSRNKKRSVAVVSSLRSNKKVSSLVDKWKAAKEELHEEEEEPENAYEILEKKRQREIEEWRAQQIASGEARDNANFQPLGGDWRERVKRKRAQMIKAALEDANDSVSEENQQPDLSKLSEGLPPGWQAFWDDSSKQVYYGNSATSETTWIRPKS